MRSASRRSQSHRALLASLLMSASSAALDAAECTELELLVSDVAPQRLVRGTFCRPQGRDVKGTLQVLVHGATFDQRYWHTSAGTGCLSYVQHQARAGYASFSFDLLGTEAGGPPASSAVTVDAHVESLHHVLRALRAVPLRELRFERVVVVGHSLGSIVAVLEAGLHHDVDGVVVSGYSHFGSPAAVQAFVGALQPAASEPQFAALDAGYFTTRPWSREALFFSPSAKLEALTWDEASKGVVSVGELQPSALGDLSHLVSVPVLIAAGELDPFSCSETACSSPAVLAEEEALWFSASPQVEALVLPAAGHALNLHPNAERWFRKVQRWADAIGAPENGPWRSSATSATESKMEAIR